MHRTPTCLLFVKAPVRRLGRQLLLSAAMVSALSLAAPEARAMVEPPAWLKDAAKAAPQAVPPSVPAVVLLHDERVTIESDGRIITSVSHAARVLTRAGRAAADAAEVYRTDTGKVRQLHGWMIPATGAVRELSLIHISEPTRQ